MKENTICTGVLLHSIIPLIGGVLVALLLSWIFVTKYVAKQKTKEQAKKLGKVHYRISMIIMFAYLTYEITYLGTVTRDIFPNFDALPVFLPFVFFFAANYYIIKRRILRVDMYGDKIDK